MTGASAPTPDLPLRPAGALGRLVFIAGVLSLVLVLGGSLATVGLSAAGIGDPLADGCVRSNPPEAVWLRIASVSMWAGVAIAIVTLVAGRRVRFVLRLPAILTAACAIPVMIVATMFAFISYGGEC